MASTLSRSLFGIVALGAAAVPASASQIHFRAQPAATPAEARLIVRDTVFRCGTGGCVAPRGSTRAELVCTVLAREVGALTSFSAAGRTFNASELEDCNRSAR